MQKNNKAAKSLWFDCLDSTIEYTRKHMAQLPHATAVYAAEQTNGRGSHGRSWTAPKGDSLLASFLYKQVSVDSLPASSLVCALAAIHTIKQCCNAKAKVKWPNDIIIYDKKVSGILCESIIQGTTASVICGVGVNLLTSRSSFEQAGLFNAGSLYTQTGRRCLPFDTANYLEKNMHEVWEEFLTDGFSKRLLQEYSNHCITLGNVVRILDGNSEKIAFAELVTQDGRLQCRDENGIFFVCNGQVSVRGINGYL